MEISCTEKVMKALCDCADTMLFVQAKEKLILAETIESLSRSIEILRGNEKGGADNEKTIL